MNTTDGELSPSQRRRQERKRAALQSQARMRAIRAQETFQRIRREYREAYRDWLRAGSVGDPPPMPVGPMALHNGFAIAPMPVEPPHETECGPEPAAMVMVVPD